MYSWCKISLLLCIFGFLKELKPSEPYVFDFLVDRRWRNITKEEIYQEVFPVGTYSYLVSLIFVFLLTDLCRYKPLIVICGLCGIPFYSLLLWTKSLLELEIAGVFHGIQLSTEVAYLTYIYANVDKKHFQLVTSYTRAAILAGSFTSSVLAQLLVIFKVMDYRQLHYITLSGQIAATIWSILLPSVEKGIYVHQSEEKQTLAQKLKAVLTIMKAVFIKSFSHWHVVKWSVIYATLTAGFVQCQHYIQPLWSEIHQQELEYNGIIEAILTFLSFVMSLAAGYINVKWGNISVAILFTLQGTCMILSSQTNHVLVAYVLYVVFGALYHFAITVASAQISSRLSDDSYGLVFGFNTFVGLVLQSLFTVLFVNGLFNFVIRRQYLTYGVYHILIATPFFALHMFACVERVATEETKSAVDLYQNSQTLNNNGSVQAT